MPAAAALWVGTTLQAVGWGLGAANVAAIGAYAAVNIAIAATLTAASSKLAAKQLNESGSFRGRELVLASAKAPEVVVYGQAWVGGVLMYANQRHSTNSKDNFEVYKVINHACHECEDITDLYYDNDLVTDSAHIDWGNNRVNAGKYGVTRSGVYAVNVSKHLGSSTQVAPALLTGAGTPISTDWTSAHRGRGRCYTVHIFTMFSLTTNTPEAIFYSGVPQNIRALVKGKKIYDPRADSTQPGGSGAQRFATPSTWTWSENPILCYADYRTQYMGVASAKMDWVWIMAQATICDALVAIPSTTQKRYTCNGAIALTNSHAENCAAILSSCLGYCPKVSGKWRPTAGAYIAADVTITEDDIVGEIVMTGSVSREERYNTVSAVYYSASEFAQEIDALEMSSATYVTRDGVALTKKLALPMTNHEYMAQRIAYKSVLQSDRQIGCVVPLRWTGLQIAIGTRVNVNYAKFGWVNKTFRCTTWKFGTGESPISVVLREDDAAAWADPTSGEYGTRNAQGTATQGTIEIPAPTAGGGLSGDTTVWNANFELGDRYWTRGHALWTISNDAANAHQGEFVLKGSVGLPLSQVNNYIRVPCTVGDTVTVGAWYKTSSPFTGSVGIGVSWLNAAGAEFASDTIPTGTLTTTYVQLQMTQSAPAGTHWVQFLIATNGVSVGTLYVDDCFMTVHAVAVLGENVYTEAGDLLAGIDVRNDMLVQKALSAINANPTFEIPRENAAGNPSPSGWWRWNVNSYITYLVAADRDIIVLPISEYQVVSGAALRVTPDTQYEIVVCARYSAAATYIQVEVAEYDGDFLGTGIRGVARNGATLMEAQLVAGNRYFQTQYALTTSFAAYSLTYTPTPGAKWFSPAFYATNAGVAVPTGPTEVEWCVVRPKKPVEDLMVYAEDFSDNDLRRFQMAWNNVVTVIGAESIVAETGTPPIIGGKYVWQAGDNAGNDTVNRALAFDHSIPVAFDVLYRLTFGYRRVAGSQNVYLGLVALGSDRVTPQGCATSGGNSHYIAASNYAPPSTAWVTKVGYFIVPSAGSTGDDKAGATTPGNPALINGACRYVSPLALMNNSAGAGIEQLSYIALERVAGYGEVTTVTLNPNAATQTFEVYTAGPNTYNSGTLPTPYQSITVTGGMDANSVLVASLSTDFAASLTGGALADVLIHVTWSGGGVYGTFTGQITYAGMTVQVRQSWDTTTIPANTTFTVATEASVGAGGAPNTITLAQTRLLIEVIKR